MKIRISQIDLPPGYTPEQLAKAAAKKVRCQPGDLKGLQVVRRSIDARGRSPRMTVMAEADLSGKLRNGLRDVEKAKAVEPVVRPVLDHFSGLRPVVVGAGPAGLMAAFALAEAGMKPLLIERGEAAAPRAKRVESFWKDGTLNVESNVLYGEGGAGLFSDGKLTSRSKDRPRVRRLLEILVECGASHDILIDAEPHIGSDILEELVPALRNRIVELGGEVRFGARLDRIEIENGALRGVVISGEEIRTDTCVLATGHSARDIYAMLSEQGITLEAKGFAVGVRLEIPQHRIDTAQWGGSFPSLGKASFRLTRREEENARSCYTFCMCPGGLVMCCASSEGMMTTNGMSLSKRDKPMGNAAFLVPVFPNDFPSTDVLAGIEFQKTLEAAAFAAGGSDYSLPAQRLVDFLEGTDSDIPAERSCSMARPAQLRGLLPEFVEHTLRSAVPKMLGSMRGVQLDEALLYASETRSSSPVRIVRGEDGQSVGARGLYPCGEGAGYAGGIVSSGIDGLRLAESIISRH
ncbi:MAG: NAD(P)/FAD-dependent oxidoreductase [Kiritimatiellales bacterium]|nr:NAD(P)/FAD-dependent oxidoreductase [Kiritimatiellota bacterium]MBL7011522.1 NAD(P)/FAD-dependent oxidoreductase [Kiritimatiellales bacterium]